MIIKRKIIIISTIFSPQIGVAANRITAFAKYLAVNNDVFVFTLGKENMEESKEGYQVIRRRNNSLFKRASFLNDSFFVHKLKAAYNKLLDFFGFDPYLKWGKDIINEIKQYYPLSQNDVLISSYAPEITHKIALELKKQNNDFLWLADMRDEMSFNPYVLKLHRKRLAKLEKKIFDFVDIITTVSRPILDIYAEMLKNHHHNIYLEEIRNGYDFDIDNFQKYNFNSVFKFCYAGSFYGKIKPEHFFTALSNLLKKQLIDDVEIILLGAKQNFYIPQILKNKIRIIKKIPYDNAIIEMRRADALLLILPNDVRKGVYSGKIYDYLAVQKPIVACVNKQDVAAQLIMETASGFIAEENNISEIEKAILKAYTLWDNKEKILPKIQEIKKMHRKNIVIKMEKTINEVMQKKSKINF